MMRRCARRMSRSCVFVGLGSNVGGPRSQVTKALRELNRLPGTRLVAHSPLYRSGPMGPPDQPDYINAVARLETRLSPVSLLRCLQHLERRHGRVRSCVRWGPRTLDLDILLFGDRRVRTHELRVPHPGIPVRDFVLFPLRDVGPTLSIPGYGRIRDLVVRCPRGELIPLGWARR